MPKSRKRREDDHRYWEARVASWSHSVAFSYKHEDRFHGAGFDDLWVLELSGDLACPEDWAGVPISGTIYGERGLARALDATAFSTGLQAAPNTWRFEQADSDYVGTLSPILKTRKPARLNLYARIPLDIFQHVIARLETGAFRAVTAMTSRREAADPRTAWITTSASSVIPILVEARS